MKMRTLAVSLTCDARARPDWASSGSVRTMSFGHVLLLVCLCLAGAACNPPPLEGKGGPCHSLTDCKPGLVCDEGKCTADLSRLAADTEDPPFLMLIDAGRDAAPPASDAAIDAGTPGDAGATPPAGDAATPPPVGDGG